MKEFRWSRVCDINFGLRMLEGNNEVELSAMTGFAVNLNALAHQGDESRGTSEAEPGATIFATGRGVALRERIKDGVLLFEGDTDSGIGNDEMDGIRIGVAGFGLHLQGDFAFVRELNGIANEIKDDLTEARGISASDFGNLGGNVT